MKKIRLVEIELTPRFMQDLGTRIARVIVGESVCLSLEYEPKEGECIHVLVCNPEAFKNIEKVLDYVYGKSKDENEQV